jgi:hypothetical protein
MAGPGGPSGPAVFASSPDASLSWAPEFHAPEFQEPEVREPEVREPEVRETGRSEGGEEDR